MARILEHESQYRVMSSFYGYQEPWAEGEEGTGYRIRTGTLAALIVVFIALCAWAGVATWYILCRDDLARQLLARQAELQYAYEDKLGALRARVDRIASRKLLEQDSFEGRVAELLSRQVELENRHAVLASFASLTEGNDRSPPPARADKPLIPKVQFEDRREAPGTDAARKPAPAPEALPLRRSPTASLDIPDATGSTGTLLRAALPQDAPLASQLDQIERSLKEVETAQVHKLGTLEERATRSLSVMRTVVADLGFDSGSIFAKSDAGSLSAPLVSASSTRPMGGPLIALDGRSPEGAFESAFVRMRAAAQALNRLKRFVDRLPLRRPMPDSEMTSSFGVRTDPFTRGPAMHSGIDFRAEQGTPVRATAPGRVISAEPAGGYGNMVEIDHGHGVTTRFAHLSAFTVQPGDKVDVGTIIGRVGSTGRSTGPHLHYETRIDGDAVDPTKFLKAGNRLGRS